MRLTLTQSTPDPADTYLRQLREQGIEKGRQGWIRIMTGLKSILETARPLSKL